MSRAGRRKHDYNKVGQQLSVRADLLPYAYCIELSKLLDNVPPIPSEEAIRIIERNLARPLDEIFDSFDPTPIGSASLACVYQAVLKTGASADGHQKASKPSSFRSRRASARASHNEKIDGTDEIEPEEVK